MRRTEQLQNLYEAAVAQVTASSQSWSDFLAFSAQIYKYSFDNSLLIYLQRPDATMLASLPLWNQLGRYVHKAERSIAVCNFQDGNARIQHLFDATQTYGQPLPVTWNLENIPIGQLVDQLYPNDVNDFYSCIYDQAHIAITSYMDMMLEGFERDIQHHFLGTLPQNGVEEQLHELLISSIISIVHHRCKQPEEIEPDFSTITHFNTIPLAARLGFYMNTIAHEILQNIARHIKIIENERSNPHDPRSKAYLQRDRWRIASRLEHIESLHSAGDSFGQIRTNGTKSSAQSSPASLSGTTHARRSDEENRRTRTGSPEQNGDIKRTTAEASSAATDQRSLRAGTSSEPTERDRRGTDPEGHPVQTDLNHTQSNSEPPTSGSFFMPESKPRTADEILEYFLQKGIGHANTKASTYQFVTEHYPVKPVDLAKHLKSVFGISGSLGKFPFGFRGFQADGKKLELSWLDNEQKHSASFTWRSVASKVLEMIQAGTYMENMAPFPPAEPEWTLFNYEEQFKTSSTTHAPSHLPEDTEQPTVEKPSSDDSMNTNHGSVPLAPSEAKPFPLASNYRFNPEMPPYVSGVKSKYRRNVEAIRLLKQLEQEDRNATADEQQTLAGYVGWGGLAQAFHPNAAGWEKEFMELKQLLDDEEYTAARHSTITSFYTEPELIQTVHQTLQRFGLSHGNGRTLLEPSMGTGNFFSVLPSEWTGAELHGVELDHVTGRIARHLYPHAHIHIHGFEQTDWGNQQFDAIFSNIPFHNVRIFDKRYPGSYLIHDYFFLRSLDLLKPGGVLAFIVSKGTLDKQDSRIRRMLAEKADLIGALRLPNTTFQSLAGTSVTTDLIFLQKREQPMIIHAGNQPDWIEIAQTTDGIPLNRYFVNHPQMILGKMAWDRGMYGAEQTSACLPVEGQDLLPALQTALNQLQASIPPVDSTLESQDHLEVDKEEPIVLRKAPPTAKNFTYLFEDERLYYCENGLLIPQNITGKKLERIKGLCAIRNALLNVIQIQSDEAGYDIASLEQAQQHLHACYDPFVAQYGAINERANTTAFADDDQLPLLRSIEDPTGDNIWVKAAIFFKPTIRPNQLPEQVNSALEALQICLNQKLHLDLPYIAHLCNQSIETVKDELGDKIYLNPQKYTGDEHEGWELAEEYLSGEVKHKLAYAILKAKEHPALFQRNVTALENVQPPPLLPGDIDFRIGSPWIPLRYYREFMYETFETSPVFQRTQMIHLDYLEFTNVWRISGKQLDRTSLKVSQTFGTSRINAYEILEQSLNLQSVTVRDPVRYRDENGNEQVKVVVNAKETMIARAKQQQLREAFASWLFQEPERTRSLLEIYNERFNMIRPRHYDGDHLVFRGMNEEMSLRKHQRDVAARIIYSGTALMAHEVGAGKTAAMIAAGMALKQIGAVQKPLYCVPNHLTEQWANEFLRFFPAANILVTTKKDFALANRQRFVSRIAMGSYDAVIIGHSQFEKIPISQERQEQLLRDEIKHVSEMIQQMKREKGDNWSVKQMVIFENSLKSQLERLLNAAKKDQLLNFEQLGVDMLFVDEAHAYKNCFTYTKMRNVAGIGQSSSQRAMDMMLKCQYLQEINQGRGVVFATGTPISNSMSELYVMQRYLQPQMLQKMGLHFFDNWAATFGEVVSSLEMTPEGSGYRMKSRFAKFHNLPELMNLFRLVADIQTAEMLQLPTPKLEGEQATIVVSECSAFQQQIMDELVERAERIRNNAVNPQEDNMLKLTHEAKLMSIDPRLVYEDAPSDPDSKLNRCIQNIVRLWNETAAEQLTQVVFCDSGTPKFGQFNVYDETKSELIRLGIPEQQIAFIHDAKTDIQREALFERVRRGIVRVLIGSTQKMGTGTNVQDRLIAAHHLDCPWRPADITQRDGRILRQGNQNETVHIFRYVTKGTFDSYLWQIQEQKLRYISQVMTGKNISRSCQDADETVLSAAEVKAIATGNPMLAEKMQVDNEVTRLKLLQANWQNEQAMLERHIQKIYPERIASYEEKVYKLQTDLIQLEQHPATHFSIELDGTRYDERSAAGDRLMLLSKLLEPDTESKMIGAYRRFQLQLKRSLFGSTMLEVQGSESYTVELGDSALGNISRLENLLQRIPEILDNTKQQLVNARQQLEVAKKEIGKPFEAEQELQKWIGRQAEINSSLEFKELQNGEQIVEGEDGVQKNQHTPFKQTEVEAAVGQEA